MMFSNVDHCCIKLCSSIRKRARDLSAIKVGTNEACEFLPKTVLSRLSVENIGASELQKSSLSRVRCFYNLLDSVIPISK